MYRETVAIEDYGGTKVATNGMLSGRILHNLLDRSGVAAYMYIPRVKAPFFGKVVSKVAPNINAAACSALSTLCQYKIKYSYTAVAFIFIEAHRYGAEGERLILERTRSRTVVD